MTIKEKSLREALEAARCPQLPRQMTSDDKRFWTEAIVLVRKRNLSLSYCIASHRGDGSIVYIADFGMMSPIVGIQSIHPYLYLDERCIPKGNNVRNTLVGFFGEEHRERITNATDEEIEILSIDYAVSLQKESVDNMRIVDEIYNASGENDEDLEFVDIQGAKQINKTKKQKQNGEDSN